MISIDASGLRARLQRVASQIEQRTRAALEIASARALVVARHGAPGKLGEQIHERPTGTHERSIISSTLVVTYQDKGTRPHEIRPVHARALAFVPKGGSALVFARRVHHPGTRALHFMSRARDEGRRWLVRLLREAIRL